MSDGPRRRTLFSSEARLAAARHLLAALGEALDANVSVRLWDGSTVPLGAGANGSLALAISEPGVLGSLLRRPSLETLLRHVLAGRIDVHHGDLLELGEAFDTAADRKKLLSLLRPKLLRRLLPLVLTPSPRERDDHRFPGVSTGRRRRDNSRFIEFHYDMTSEFFRLFLDPEMQYSCAYFDSPDDTLEEAQRRKLEGICRTLQLRPGHRLLDVGCGWGGLICWAGRHHGARAHGLTLSREQREFAQRRIHDLGLSERVTVEVRDLFSFDAGSWDRIASVGMYEHVGLANLERYFARLRDLLEPGGIVVNQGMASKTKSERGARRIPAATRLAQDYLFPGLELASLDHTVRAMETSGLEAREVVSLRDHYALTSREWCRRLLARREEAVRQVGETRYRLLLLCLVAMRFGFKSGSMRSYRIVATHRGASFTFAPPTAETADACLSAHALQALQPSATAQRR